MPRASCCGALPMAFQIVGCSSKHRGRVLHHADGRIASSAEESSDLAGDMIVIEMRLLSRFQNLPANGAATFLRSHQGLLPFRRDSVPVVQVVLPLVRATAGA